MTSLDLAKAFEASFNHAVESQKKQIKHEFEKSIMYINDNISSYLSVYKKDDDFHIDVAIFLRFICLDPVKEWASEYFEKMGNVVIESILTGYSYSAGTEITKIELKIYA